MHKTNENHVFMNEMHRSVTDRLVTLELKTFYYARLSITHWDFSRMEVRIIVKVNHRETSLMCILNAHTILSVVGSTNSHYDAAWCTCISCLECNVVYASCKHDVVKSVSKYTSIGVYQLSYVCVCNRKNSHVWCECTIVVRRNSTRKYGQHLITRSGWWVILRIYKSDFVFFCLSVCAHIALERPDRFACKFYR